MGQCKGKAANGHRCMRQLPGVAGYCNQHRDQRTLDEAIVLGMGALAGHALVPGLGGAVGGALGAKVLQALADEPTRKPRVFVSFDFDNDQSLKHLLVGQTQRGDVAFQIVDGSLKEAAPEHNWQAKARREIRSSDLVVVLLGRKTHRAPGVLEEVKIAREERVRIVQLLLKSASGYQRVPNAGRTLAWTHDNLNRLFAKV